MKCSLVDDEAHYLHKSVVLQARSISHSSKHKDNYACHTKIATRFHVHWKIPSLTFSLASSQNLKHLFFSYRSDLEGLKLWKYLVNVQNNLLRQPGMGPFWVENHLWQRNIPFSCLFLPLLLDRVAKNLCFIRHQWSMAQDVTVSQLAGEKPRTVNYLGTLCLITIKQIRRKSTLLDIIISLLPRSWFIMHFQAVKELCK